MSSELILSQYNQLPPEFQKTFDLFLEALVSTTSKIKSNEQSGAPRKAKREFGSVKGKLWMADDFDAPIPGFDVFTNKKY
jgi:hypothetical protein